MDTLERALVDLEGADPVHARDPDARAEDGAPEHEPEQIGRMTFACAQARM